jgi:putative transcriptional regulator
MIASREADCMIRIHLSKILGEKRMNQAELARRTGLRPNTVGLLYNELTDNIKLDYLETICRELDCDITDILELVEGENPRKRLKRQKKAKK